MAPAGEGDVKQFNVVPTGRAHPCVKHPTPSTRAITFRRSSRWRSANTSRASRAPGRGEPVASDGVIGLLHRDTALRRDGRVLVIARAMRTRSRRPRIGQWEHPAGGPYVSSPSRQGEPLETHPIIGCERSLSFASARAIESQSRHPAALGRRRSARARSRRSTGRLQAPLPPGRGARRRRAPLEKYG